MVLNNKGKSNAHVYAFIHARIYAYMCINIRVCANKYAYAGSEIAPSWSPMRLKIEYWRPEFHSWSPVGDLLLSSEPFANNCLTFYPAGVFEIKMKGVFPLTTSIGLHNVASRHAFLRFLIKYVLRAKKLRLSREI